MKKILFVLVSLIVLFGFTSCSSTEAPDYGYLGMFPMRDVPVANIDELQSGSFEVLGMVTGEANVSIEYPYDGDTQGYGSLEILDVDRMYFGVDLFSRKGQPYFIALSNAINEMTKNAREMGASFVTFPSYTLDLVDGRIHAVVSATAVKLVNPPEEVVINHSLPDTMIN